MHAVLPAALMKYGEQLISLLRKYPSDFGPPPSTVPKPEDLPPPYRSGLNRDEWGTIWHSSVDGIHGQPVDWPLKNWDRLEEYEFPPLPDPGEIERLKRSVEERRSKGYFVIIGFKPGNFFEKLQHLRGYTNLLRDLVTGDPRLSRLADRLLEYCIKSINMALEAKPDAISFSDDWGTQDRLMIKPDLWRSFFKPRYREMFKLVRDHGCYVYFHSDGYIIPIIRDLAEIGVNILNPQFSCHKLDELAETVRDRLCVSSDVDRQYILPRGTVSEVKEYVKRVIELFGHGNNGGLICRGEINFDVPLRNVKAMYKAFIKYGTYKW